MEKLNLPVNFRNLLLYLINNSWKQDGQLQYSNGILYVNLHKKSESIHLEYEVSL